MNVNFPDNANIQILVLPAGASNALDAESGSARVLLAPPARKPSRRRDVLFFGTGAILCMAVLTVVRVQQTAPTPAMQPAHAASSSGRPDLAPPAPPAPRLAPDRADNATAAPDVDPREAVRRLLAERPTVTPPPGAKAPAPAAAPTPDAAPSSAGKRNAFGMTD